VEFSGCLGTDVPSRVERQKTCGSLEQNPKTLTIKQQAKDLFYFTILYILFSIFISPITKNTLRGGRQRPKNCYWIFYVFTPTDSSGGLDPQPVALMGEVFKFFKQNVLGNEGFSINGHTIL